MSNKVVSSHHKYICRIDDNVPSYTVELSHTLYTFSRNVGRFLRISILGDQLLLISSFVTMTHKTCIINHVKWESSWHIIGIVTSSQMFLDGFLTTTKSSSYFHHSKVNHLATNLQARMKHTPQFKIVRTDAYYSLGNENTCPVQYHIIVILTN